MWSRIERNVRFAVEYGALFEVNASAFRKGWSTGYPGAEVFDVRAVLANPHVCTDSRMYAILRSSLSHSADALRYRTTRTGHKQSGYITTEPTATSRGEDYKSSGTWHRQKKERRGGHEGWSLGG